MIDKAKRYEGPIEPGMKFTFVNFSWAGSKGPFTVRAVDGERVKWQEFDVMHTGVAAIRRGDHCVPVDPPAPAPATYSCPCARMNLRDLSGDPVCYCTERPKPVRVVGTYRNYEVATCSHQGEGYCTCFVCKQTGVATGLAMEAVPKTRTEIACERAARRYGSTGDNEPSGA